jgi:hypothetical protein
LIKTFESLNQHNQERKRRNFFWKNRIPKFLLQLFAAIVNGTEYKKIPETLV